ncbi:MAG: hypothetical protein IJ039_03675 [Clostridia bacterium]|nr:hypothetical protein [Clostridia bacterium]
MKPEKIRVTPDMLINDFGVERIENYFCEFDNDGDPLYGVEGAAPQIHQRHDHWWIGESDLCFTVDLGAIYQITNMYIFNNYDEHKPEKDKHDYGVRKVKVKMGTPFSWEYNEELAPEVRKWTGFETKYETQYINFSFNNNQAPSEIIIYGYKVRDIEKDVPERAVQTFKKLDKFVGMNAFVNDADDICRAVTYIREYHPWLWTVVPDGENTSIAMSPSLNKAWDFDEYYSRMKRFGINVCPTISTHSKRTPKDLSPNSWAPENFLSYACMLFQFVARYGSNKNIDPSLIKVDEGQEIKIGMGVLDAVEPLNEPDGTWLGREQYFSPFEMASFLSMCYDGHEGKYKNCGVKQADPNFLMSMSGGAGLSYSRLKAVEFWCKYNRKDGKLPFDVINAHCYCGKKLDEKGVAELVDVNLVDRGDQTGNIFVGVSPEEGHVVANFDSIRDWRDRYYPNMEIWLTEFGWDTNQSYKTSTSAHAYAEYTGRQVQAMWLVREYLLLSSIGVDRAAMYMSRDCGPEETAVGKYGSSGLVRFPIEIAANNVIQGNKKDSFYYIYTLKETLKDCTFAGEIESTNANVKIFKYVNDEGKAKYAIWCTTSDGTKVPGYILPVGQGEYSLVEFGFEQYKGKWSNLENNNGKVVVNVSECPVFVVEK